MALIVIGALVLATVMVYQGIYVIRNGGDGWFFMPSVKERPLPRSFDRVRYGVIFAIPGVAIPAILIIRAIQVGLTVIGTWIVSNFGLLAGAYFSL